LPWWAFGEGDEDDERVKDGIYSFQRGLVANLNGTSVEIGRTG